jgi:hypothetical protein
MRSHQSIKPKSELVHRPLSKRAMLRQALLKLLYEHERDGTIPTSARFLFYELIVLKIISKTPTGKRRADQDMSDALTSLREDGTVPWDWIADETRHFEDYSGSASIKEALLDSLAYARLDPWAGAPPVILTESRSLAGVLRPIVREYGAKIASTNGQCGGFLHTEIAPRLHEDQHVLYFGDRDLCGGDIEGNTQRVLERIVGELRWERLALTQTQVDFYRLPVIIKHDRRFNNGGEHEAVETEALSQSVIMQILRDRLDELMPEPLERIHERADAERERIRIVLENLE